MKTVLSHFYNEEYLLPWWLNHHKKYFDHGIMIDYHSTDTSVEIIKSICPTWDIITTRNDCFDARKVDEEVMYYESQISGWKMTLNSTEFLYGNFNILNEFIPNEDQYFLFQKNESILEIDILNLLIFLNIYFLYYTSYCLPIHKLKILYLQTLITNRHLLILYYKS